MQLTKHFSLEELTKTNQKGDNTPSDLIKSNVQITAELLEQIRELFGKPITVNSGYRSEVVNKAVGGSKNSQHVKGQAADIEINGISNYDLAKQIVDSDIKFDQLILEFYTIGQPNSGWVHVSWADKPRGQVLTAVKEKGKTVYKTGLLK